MLGLALIVTSACSSGDAARPADEIEAVPFDDTRTLTSSDLDLLEEASADGTLTFRKIPASLTKVARGDVLVAGVSDKTRAGLLRIVTGVDAADGGLRLQTLNAPIQLAFRKLHVRVARTSDLIQPEQDASRTQAVGLTMPALDTIEGPSGRASKTETFDYPLFDGDGDEETEDDRIELSGEIGGTVDYRFGMDFDWGAFEHLPETVSDCIDKLLSGEIDCSLDSLLPEAKISFTADTTLSAQAKLEGAAIMSFERSFPVLPAQVLAEIPLGIFVLAPVVEIEGKIEGGASGHFETGIQAAATISNGVDISSKRLGNPAFHGPDVTDVSFDVDEPSVSLQANVRAEVTARVNLLLYDVVGPSASASIYAEVTADPFGDPCFSLDAGIEADLGIVVEPTLPLLGSVTLFDWRAPTWTPYEAPVTEGSCSRPPMASHLPPGSGADADHYAMPNFEPWSQLVSASIDGSVASSPTDDTSSVDLQRTIDGRYVVAGSTFKTLLKMDESGAVTWARSYALEHDAAALRVIATTPTRDANLFALAQDPVTAELAVMILDQSGAIVRGTGLQLQAAEPCTPVARAIVPDDDTGVWIAGSCIEHKLVWLIHGDKSLQFKPVVEISTADHARISLTALAMSDGEPVLGGLVLTADGDQMFVTRFSSVGELTYARAYVGCEQSPDLAPRAAVAGANGDVTFVGSGGGNHNGFLMRIRHDGSVGFASFPGLSFGASDVLALQGIVELPTTGYVVSGSTVDLLGDARTTTPAIAILGLDAVGAVRWAARYSLLEPDGSARATGFPGVRLTDDGGIYVTGVAGASRDLRGAAWAFKAFAKDGALDFDPARAERTPLMAANLECGATTKDLSLRVNQTPAVGRSLKPEATKSTPEALKISLP
ncbi:MAG TPA: hypothetical protein VFG30_42570 [Polyangiales bacterium]|nr:hypothetical protein [Polyangiales bacterium]